MVSSYHKINYHEINKPQIRKPSKVINQIIEKASHLIVCNVAYILILIFTNETYTLLWRQICLVLYQKCTQSAAVFDDLVILFARKKRSAGSKGQCSDLSFLFSVGNLIWHQVAFKSVQWIVIVLDIESMTLTYRMNTEAKSFFR